MKKPKTYKENLLEHYHGIIEIATQYNINGLKYSPHLSSNKDYVLIFERPEHMDITKKQECEEKFTKLLGVGVQIVSEYYIRDTMENSRFMSGHYDGVIEGAVSLKELLPNEEDIQDNDKVAVTNNFR